MNKYLGISIAAAVTILASFGWWLLNQSNTPLTFQTGSGYTFETTKKEDADFGGYSEFGVSVHKDGKLLKTISIENVNTDASDFTFSPDEKHVAFTVSLAEGGCTQADTVKVIDLQNLMLSDVSEIENSLQATQQSGPKLIDDIRWVDNATVEVSMTYGLEDTDICGPYSTAVKKFTLAQ